MCHHGPVATDDQLPRTELTFLLGMAFQLLIAEFDSRLSEAGFGDLRPVHGMALQAVRGGGTTGTELAAHLGMTKQAAGRIVDELEERDYVRRAPHPAGGRRKLIVLTEAAHRHLAVAGGILHDLEAEVARRAGVTELSGLRTELARVIRALHRGTLPPLRPVW